MRILACTLRLQPAGGHAVVGVLGESLWPHDSPASRNGSDHVWLERHPSTALGREEFLGLEIANPQEDQLAAFRSLKPHSAETHLGGAIAIFSEDNLIGWQRHSRSVFEDDGRARETVLKNRQRRRELHERRIVADARTWNELDKQRIIVRSLSYAVGVAAARPRWNFSNSWLARTITARFSSTAPSCGPGIAR